MIQRIIRVREGQQLPAGTTLVRLLTIEAVPVGSGTNTERDFVILVAEKERDDRQADP